MIFRTFKLLASGDLTPHCCLLNPLADRLLSQAYTATLTLHGMASKAIIPRATVATIQFYFLLGIALIWLWLR